jgi:hypothetical protein
MSMLQSGKLEREPVDFPLCFSEENQLTFLL